MGRVLLTVFAVIIAGMALTLTPAAAGGGCHDPEATEASASMVELRNACFTSTVTHIDPGQELAFVNRDNVVHNIIGFGAGWGEPVGMGQGETRRFTFEEDGIYPYACTLHVGMVGAVVVGGDEQQAGDVGSVSVGPSSGSAGTGGGTSTGAGETNNRLPAVALGLTALVLGAGLILRRRRGSPAGM